MEYDPQEVEFYEMNAKRNQARNFAQRFNEINHVPHYESIRAGEFYEDKMQAHPFWEEWAATNREEAYAIEKRAAIRAQQEKDAVEKGGRGRDNDREREKDR